MLAPQWFGAPGLPPCIGEVPLESFDAHLDRLAELSLPLVVMGTSMGAEAALLVATHRPDVDVVAALAPTAVVGEGLSTPNEPVGRSSWTRHGTPLPHLPFVDEEAAHPFASTCEVHEASLRHHPASLEEAAIRTEDIRADVVLAAGGDDPVWPPGAPARRALRAG